MFEDGVSNVRLSNGGIPVHDACSYSCVGVMEVALLLYWDMQMNGDGETAEEMVSKLEGWPHICKEIQAADRIRQIDAGVPTGAGVAAARWCWAAAVRQR